MKALLFVTLFVACAYDRPADVIGDIQPDDAAVDAEPDAEPDAEIDAMEGSALGAACTPTDPTSCTGANNRCAWIIDTDTPSVTGHTGCVPAGTVAVGGACTATTVGLAGYSNCVAGAECQGGECRNVCAVNAAQSGCDANHNCTLYSDLFSVGGTIATGLCDPGCNPLTQDLLAGANRTACGSPNPTSPTKGCYGFDKYGCAPIPASSLSLTDRMPPRTNAGGNPYLNGCAPGFIPFLFSMTGSTQALCTGLCGALETDNSAAHVNNGKGSTTALAKLPTQAAPVAGNATCDIGKKGSESTSRCVFIWPFLLDDVTGELPPQFDQGPYRDTLGICMSINRFQYDSNGDMVPDTNFPECSARPKRSIATPGDFDDAADFNCQLQANSQAIAGPKRPRALRDSWVQWKPSEPVPLTRHALR